MTPPSQASAAAPAGWAATLPGFDAAGRLRVLALAAAVLALTVLGVLAFRVAPASLESLATRQAGTAFLGTATCSDWRSAGQARRSTIAAALGTAATAPDPENPGATLDEGATFGLFRQACSTRASSSSLLYEVYNRAAAFSSAPTAPMVREGGFGTALHR